ncbi:MAG: AAA family ATPase [Candidatus Gracilibacteria bacterium]|nr:AAA family ATPase [Candidatus Gracilibacteria bacterium]
MQLFEQLLKRNKDYILSKEITRNYNVFLKKIVNSINKEKIIIISGMKYIGKTEVISDFIKKTKIEDRFFYFNKDLDNQNIIKNNINLENLLNIQVNYNKNTRYIILQNISHIEGIKDFLSKIHKENYKIIIIGNDIKIPNITEIEIKNVISENIKNDTLYGNIGNLSNLTTTKIKENYISLIKDSIILNKIVGLKLVKNVFLYNYMLTKIAEIDYFLTQRELHRIVEDNSSVALKTFMDYIEFSLQEKIIYKIELYDLKKEKVINNRNKYYFCDNGIKNSYGNFMLDKNKLIENLVFIQLNYNDFSIFGGLNGLFEFSFIAKKSDKTIYIHICKETEKSEIKKEINKLLKVPGENKRYLVLEDLENLGVKKTIYGNLEIVSAEELIKKI